MKIIKLNAIDSTNSFLKEMSVNSPLESFTVVTTNEQTSGRGQMQNKWVSEVGKSLTFSVFVKFENFLIQNQKYLSFVVSTSIYEALLLFSIPKLAIKWPNDIMAGADKIAGVLIENSLKKDKIQSSVIGIGLNVNQESFPEELCKATSLKKLLGKEIDLEDLLNKLLKRLQKNIELLNNNEYSIINHTYLSVLYKFNTPSMYKDVAGNMFMGKIIGVSPEGKLQLELENEIVKEFDLKEVVFL